jgi:mevalonate kinase
LNQKYYSNGKLLFTGEYVVLDGANALAFPTKFGQSMSVTKIKEPKIIWKSFNCNDELWLHYEFSINDIELPQNKIGDEKDRLISIFKEAKKLNPKFLNKTNGYSIITQLHFEKNWGLGSSSTLISNISKWANVDPFKLLDATFGGSGYDIAAAQSNVPILYAKTSKRYHITGPIINWDFTNQLFFVHLNKKQNSRDGIFNYQKLKNSNQEVIGRVNELTTNICHCQSLLEFESIINEHEQLISKIIQQKTVKELLFNDYKGSIKSLGAWGGDFILATGNQKDWNYFNEKGFETILSFKEMIL